MWYYGDIQHELDTNELMQAKNLYCSGSKICKNLQNRLEGWLGGIVFIFLQNLLIKFLIAIVRTLSIAHGNCFLREPWM